MWDLRNGLASGLATVLTQAGVSLTGWTLSDANAVSADGLTIVGSGVNPQGHKESWIATIPQPYARGDATQDGQVNGDDFVALAVNYTGTGGTGKTWSQGDFDYDGDVDGDDFVTLAVNYTGTLHAVPEPVSWSCWASAACWRASAGADRSATNAGTQPGDHATSWLSHVAKSATSSAPDPMGRAPGWIIFAISESVPNLQDLSSHKPGDTLGQRPNHGPRPLDRGARFSLHPPPGTIWPWCTSGRQCWWRSTACGWRRCCLACRATG